MRHLRSLSRETGAFEVRSGGRCVKEGEPGEDLFFDAYSRVLFCCKIVSEKGGKSARREGS